MARYIVARQGYAVLDTVNVQTLRYKSASEASYECKRLNDWWDAVQRESASVKVYNLRGHIHDLRNKKSEDSVRTKPSE